MDAVQALKTYVQRIQSTDKVAVLYHAFCTDGLCSSVITIKALERLLRRKVDYHIHYTTYEITEEILAFFRKNTITKVVVVDLSLYAREDMIRRAEEVADLLILDHHEYKHDMTSAKTTFLHASVVKPDVKSHAYPASKLCYDLFSQLVNVDDLDWLACCGLLADQGYTTWKDFFVQTLRKYHLEQKDDPFNTALGNITSNLGAGNHLSNSGDEIFTIAYNAASYADVLKDKSLVQLRNEANAEIQYWIERRNEAEVHGNLVIFVVKPKRFIASALSTLLSLKFFVGKTVVVIHDTGERLKVHARDQSLKVRTNDLLQKAIAGLSSARAGGHAPASAGEIQREDLERFKQNLIEAYKTLGTKA